MSKKQYRSMLLLAIISAFVVGCATMGNLRPGSGSSFEIYDRAYDEIWKAAVRVVGRSLTIVESKKDSGVIKAEARAGFATWGEVVGVYIAPARKGEKRYIIEVLSLKRARYQITGQNWEPAIIAGIKAELDL